MADLKLNDILVAIDFDGKEAWDEFTEEQKKSVVFFTLNRYISNVSKATKPWQKGKNPAPEEVEYFVNACNELFNKHLFAIMTKHPKLTWLSACSCGLKEELYNHEWIALKKEKDKKTEFLLKLFPEMKRQDVETLSKITTKEEIKKYCENLGWSKKEISEIKI